MTLRQLPKRQWQQFFEGTERQIRHPAQVLVRVEDECLHSLELVDRAGEHDFVIFREPLPLPEPA